MISFADLDDGDLDDSVADHIKACRFQVKKQRSLVNGIFIFYISVNYSSLGSHICFFLNHNCIKIRMLDVKR